MIATISKVTIHLADGNGNAYLVEFKDAYDEDSAVYKLTDGTRVRIQSRELSAPPSAPSVRSASPTQRLRSDRQCPPATHRGRARPKSESRAGPRF